MSGGHSRLSGQLPGTSEIEQLRLDDEAEMLLLDDVPDGRCARMHRSRREHRRRSLISSSMWTRRASEQIPTLEESTSLRR